MKKALSLVVPLALAWALLQPVPAEVLTSVAVTAAIYRVVPPYLHPMMDGVLALAATMNAATLTIGDIRLRDLIRRMPPRGPGG